MVELWLLRHGETDWNREGRYQGQTDVLLNDTGRRQALEVSKTLPGTTFAAIFSSDLRRAAETAEIQAAVLGLPVQLDRRLREVCFGEWESQLVREVQKGRDLREQSIPVDARAPGGESILEVAARTAAAADEMDRLYAGRRVLVVAHGLSLATLICQAEGVPLAQASAHTPRNCVPQVIKWGQGLSDQ